MAIMSFFLPAALVAVVGAVTGRVWLALLPLVFVVLFAWGGMSLEDATSLMLLAAAVLGTAAGLKGVWARQRRSA